MKHFLESVARLLIKCLDQAADKIFVKNVADILPTEFATFAENPVHASAIFNAIDDCLAMLIAFKNPNDPTDIACKWEGVFDIQQLFIFQMVSFLIIFAVILLILNLFLDLTSL